MRIWIITDTHFGHGKLVELADRPRDFGSKILESLRHHVKPGDTVIHLGDFCIGKDLEWHGLFMEATADATRILIRGNHDHKSYGWYFDHGWHLVCEEFVMKVNGKKVLFTHRPTPRRADYIDHNLHGHTHGNTHRGDEHDDFYEEGYHIEMALEKTHYMPLLIENIVR